jgi:Holliday junction DNA helicase RuvA
MPTMFDFLTGTVATVDASGRLALDVNGVGYSLRISEQTRARIPLDGRPVRLSVRLVVREDDLILYGFSDSAERAAFDLLTSVQMVGPALAMSVLSALGVDALRAVLASRDVAALKRIKGIGAKSAERIVMELVDKVERIPATVAASSGGAASPPFQTATDAVREALRALIVLGYSTKEASQALERCHLPGMASETLLREALALLR